MFLVAAVKGFTNRYFSKLCKYNFDGANVTCSFYYYDQVVTGDSGIRIGKNTQMPRCYLSIEDADAEIQCPQGIGGSPVVIQGTFSDSLCRRTITWSTGGTETWEMGDSKWRLVDASYCHGDCHGWGFLSDGIGQLDLTKTFTGELQRYNGWNQTNESPLAGQVFNFYQLQLTDRGAFRFVQWDPVQRLWVFKYLAAVGDRIIYQVSHDFDNNGRIDLESGHTYVGYTIMQSGQHRGFVFSDASKVIGFPGTFGAMYFWQ